MFFIVIDLSIHLQALIQFISDSTCRMCHYFHKTWVFSNILDSLMCLGRKLVGIDTTNYKGNHSGGDTFGSATVILGTECQIISLICVPKYLLRNHGLHNNNSTNISWIMPGNLSSLKSSSKGSTYQLKKKKRGGGDNKLAFFLLIDP